MKINSGGLCGTSKWREYFVEKVGVKGIKFINLVVKNWSWNENAKEEKQQRILSCDLLVDYIAPPLQGFSSVASAVD